MKNTYHHKDLHNALLLAAIEILKTKSFSEMSMRELATETGVSHAAPYRHFKDKTALLASLATYGYEQIKAVCLNADLKYPSNPVKALEEAGIGYLLFVFENSEVSNLMFSGVLPAELWPTDLDIAAQEAIGALSIIIEKGKYKNIFSTFTSKDMTLASLSMVHGAAMFIAAGLLNKEVNDTATIRKLGKRLTNILLNGILAKKK